MSDQRGAARTCDVVHWEGSCQGVERDINDLEELASALIHELREPPGKLVLVLQATTTLKAGSTACMPSGGMRTAGACMAP